MLQQTNVAVTADWVRASSDEKIILIEVEPAYGTYGPYVLIPPPSREQVDRRLRDISESLFEEYKGAWKQLAE